MNGTAAKLEKFFEEIKTLTFWQRVFGWSRIRALSYDAYQEFKALLSHTGNSANEIATAKAEKLVLETNNANLHANNQQQKVDMATVREKLTHLETENARLSGENIALKQAEEGRKQSYENNVAALNAIKEQIQSDRQREIVELQQAKIDDLTRQQETWATHETKVREAIKGICHRYTIEYVDKVPFKGNPDNTIKLSNEYIIFDAKSPASDDLENFFAYIKQQTESVKKYIKEEDVKKEIYLVIPSNTVDVIEQTAFNMADYNVFVVTLDALEPLILALKKLEDYEFVDQLSPEERENICRVIGRFAHMTKRRIQIDLFFDRLFLEILSKCDSDLPEEIMEKAVEYEKAEKLNPPQEKRSKTISNKTLDMDTQQVAREAEAKGIAFPSSTQDDAVGLALYGNDKSDSTKS